MLSVIKFKDDHGVAAASAFDEVVAKDRNNGISPDGERQINESFSLGMALRIRLSESLW